MTVTGDFQARNKRTLGWMCSLKRERVSYDMLTHSIDTIKL